MFLFCNFSGKKNMFMVFLCVTGLNLSLICIWLTDAAPKIGKHKKLRKLLYFFEWNGQTLFPQDFIFSNTFFLLYSRSSQNLYCPEVAYTCFVKCVSANQLTVFYMLQDFTVKDISQQFLLF